MQTPSVGRIVHYVRIETLDHEASIITAISSVGEDIVHLICFPASTDLHHKALVRYDARMSPGTWHYPEVVNTVSHHESEDEAEKREGPISNSPEIR